MSKTVKEVTETGVENQLDLAVRNLISAMDLESVLDITIVEEETKPPWFEVSLEYPPYENSPQKFQRRVSISKAEEIARNIYYNIKDVLGFEYKAEEFKLLQPPGEIAQHDRPISSSWSDSGKVLYKKIHIRIGFIENRIH